LKANITERQKKSLTAFAENLQGGIDYYSNLYSGLKEEFKSTKSIILADLNAGTNSLNLLKADIAAL